MFWLEDMALLMTSLFDFSFPQVDSHKYKLAVIRAILNIAFVNVPMTMMMYHIAVWRGVSFGYDGIPDLFTAVWQLATIALIKEACFYYSHRYIDHAFDSFTVWIS